MSWVIPDASAKAGPLSTLQALIATGELFRNTAGAESGTDWALFRRRPGKGEYLPGQTQELLKWKLPSPTLT